MSFGVVSGIVNVSTRKKSKTGETERGALNFQLKEKLKRIEMDNNLCFKVEQPGRTHQSRTVKDPFSSWGGCSNKNKKKGQNFNYRIRKEKGGDVPGGLSFRRVVQAANLDFSLEDSPG